MDAYIALFFPAPMTNMPGRAWVALNSTPCPKGCGPQFVTSTDHSPGFAGGGIYFDNLACGHQIIDDSGDVEAAR